MVLLLLVLSNSHSKKMRKSLILLRNFDNGLRRSRRGKTGIILPAIAMGTTEYQGILNRLMPTGIPPLSSKIGSMDTMSIAITG